MTFSHFLKNGELLPLEEAHVSYLDINYSYGYGVYETVRVQDGMPYFLEQHLERLIQSAQLLDLEPELTKEKLEKWIQLLLDHIKATSCKLSASRSLKLEARSCRFNLKILLIGGHTAQDANLIILPLNPLFPDRAFYKHGAKYLSVQYERWMPQIKSLNMLPSYCAHKKAKKAGCYDALLIDSNGNILEGTKSNFFALKGKTLYTPPSNHVLEGVTRAIIMDLASKNGYTVQEANIPLIDITNYDSCFTTASSAKIIPISTIDAIELGNPSDQLKQLMNMYNEFLETCDGILEY